MWLSWMLTLGVLVVDAAQEQRCIAKVCRNRAEGRPVCGSNGITYPSRCHLERARCQNKDLTLEHKGACQTQRPCLAALVYANTHPENTFKPHCKPDGSYSSAQCDPEVGYCWCVNPKGTPLPHTAVRWTVGIKPRCNRRKKTTRRRSPSRAGKPKRACKRADKAVFNNNLIKIFHTEFSRDSGGMLPLGMDADRAVLHWEFKRLDRDHNDVLDKTEYRDLRKIVRKAVKPKRCAKSFAKACDMNRDQLISIHEWAECLSRDGIDDKGEDAANADDEDEDDEDEGDDLFPSPPSPPHGVLYSGGNSSSSGHSYEDDSVERRDDDATDCFSDRQTALSEPRADKLYVPECTPDGRYQKIQCYKSAGYCWCVNEDTGKNIPGTSVKNQTPKCDQIPAPSRPMKGCPDDKKKVFLKDFMEYMHQRMLKEVNGTSITGDGAAWKVSREEQIATWSFVVFDKNKNKILDRNEWKMFKDLVSGVKTIKRCGKKFLRYCDINKDRYISMTEWLDCLNTQRYVSEHVATTISPGSIRTGKNPLTMLLDD